MEVPYRKFHITNIIMLFIGPVVRKGTYAARSSPDCPSDSVAEDILTDAIQLLASDFDVRPLGLIKSYAAVSCDQIFIAGPGSKSGLYWIKGRDGDVNQVMCDF